MVSMECFRTLSANAQADVMLQSINLYIISRDLKKHGLTIIFILSMLQGYMNNCYPDVKKTFSKTWELIKQQGE